MLAAAKSLPYISSTYLVIVCLAVCWVLGSAALLIALSALSSRLSRADEDRPTVLPLPGPPAQPAHPAGPSGSENPPPDDSQQPA
jgi:hypothetical protein